MKDVQKKLAAISKTLSSLAKQVDQMAKAVNKAGKKAPAKKKAAAKKAKATVGKKKASPKKKAAPKKRAAKKKAPKAKAKSAARGGTMLDNVLGLISKSHDGISVEQIKKKSGLDRRQVSNALYKLTQRAQIETLSRGVYVKKK
jgi:hypothetical protein